jgi:formylmethanofuran dehydrogenase subunit E
MELMTKSTRKTTKYRKLSSLKSKGDIEWLKTKTCPYCSTRGKMMMSPGGEYPNERIVCLQCGRRFYTKGRPKT